MRRLAQFLLLSGLLCSCTTPHEERPSAFHSALSLQEVNFALRHLTRYLDNPAPVEDHTAKRCVLDLWGGFKNRPLTVSLPDKSTLQARILSPDRILLSGYPGRKNLRVFISKYQGEYYVTIERSDDPSASATFVITSSGAVRDEGILISCAA